MPKFKPFVKNSPAEQAIRTSDRTAATLRNRMKSIFVPMGTRLIRRIFFSLTTELLGPLAVEPCDHHQAGDHDRGEHRG